MPVAIEDLWVKSADGLRLHVHAAGPRDSRLLPAVCLPGIARTGEDFIEVMQALAGGPSPRRVIAVDARGRGLSEWDNNPANYNPLTELADVIAVLDATGIERAIFIGTSRGGILTMLLPAARPHVVAGAVLNDIGPVIEMAGLLRIKSYVGKLPKPRSWAEAVSILRRTMEAQFPALDDTAWELWTRRTFTDAGGQGIEPRYDPALSAALAAADPATPPPALWAQFDALASVPAMVMRGEHSDILSRATLGEMQARHPRMQSVEIPGQGHAPLLIDDRTIAPIVKFVEGCDAAAES